MIRKFIALLLFTAILSWTLKAHAATLNAGALEVSYSGNGPLFNEFNIFPGYVEVKSVSIKNTGRVNHSFSIAVSGQLGKLADVLQIEPRSFNTDDPIWNKTVRELAESTDSDVILGSIEPGQTRQVKIAAILPADVGNVYQDSTTLSFDFVVGNEIEDLSEIKDRTIHDIIVPSDIKNILASSAATKNVVENIDVARQPIVEKIVPVATSNEQGKTAGVTAENKKVCFWWWILLLLLAIFLVFYKMLIKNHKGWFYLFWPSFVGAFIYVIHWITHDYYDPSKWCGWWFASVLIFEVLFYYLFNSRSHDNRVVK